MAERRTRDVAWDEDFWVDGSMSGSAHYVSDQTTPSAPSILVPDGKGDYRPHEVVARPKGRLGF